MNLTILQHQPTNLTSSSHCPTFSLTHGEPTSRRTRSEGDAESVPKHFGTDPLNLLQVMLAKGSNARLGPPRCEMDSSKCDEYDVATVSVREGVGVSPAFFSSLCWR